MRERPFDPTMSAGIVFPDNVLAQGGCYYSPDTKKFLRVDNPAEYEEWLRKQDMEQTVEVAPAEEMPVELSYLAPAVLTEGPHSRPKWDGVKVRSEYIKLYGIKQYNALTPPKIPTAAGILGVDFFYNNASYRKRKKANVGG